MAILMGDLRAALVNAGATEELANKAATEVATYEARLASVDSRLSLLTWMVGATLAMSMTILFKVFH
jgi:phage shock protein A